jgi:hypothetical protein
MSHPILFHAECWESHSFGWITSPIIQRSQWNLWSDILADIEMKCCQSLTKLMLNLRIQCDIDDLRISNHSQLQFQCLTAAFQDNLSSLLGLSVIDDTRRYHWIKSFRIMRMRKTEFLRHGCSCQSNHNARGLLNSSVQMEFWLNDWVEIPSSSLNLPGWSPVPQFWHKPINYLRHFESHGWWVERLNHSGCSLPRPPRQRSSISLSLSPFNWPGIFARIPCWHNFLSNFFTDDQPICSQWWKSVLWQFEVSQHFHCDSCIIVWVHIVYDDRYFPSARQNQRETWSSEFSGNYRSSLQKVRTIYGYLEKRVFSEGEKYHRKRQNKLSRSRITGPRHAKPINDLKKLNDQEFRNFKNIEIK